MARTHASSTIVVGIDGSASSIHALRWAVRQAQLTDSVLQALMAWQYPVVPGVPEDLDVEAQSRRALDGAIEAAFSGAAPVQTIQVVEDGGPGCPVVVLRGRASGPRDPPA
jgi:nucleotide-binding universal stress UspA family protein